MRKFTFFLLCQLLYLFPVLAQDRTITGKVTDDGGLPVSSASVIVKGTRNGTVTKADGTFSISVRSNAKTLVISSINFDSREIAISSGSVFDVTMTKSDKPMSEVVIVAYGTQKRAEMTGSVGTVKGAEIENQPFTSIDKALQGQVAGLQSVAFSGQPGAAQQIRIRGISSITAGNNPLWVIDGVIINAGTNGDLSRQTTTANVLSTINPNDIESISVLKDAGSASIYGSRAANGVILVTTKKGRAGKTKIRLDMEIGQSDIAYENGRYMPLNAAEYIAITTEGLVNAGVAPATITATMAARGATSGIDFNWRDAATQKGTQQQFNASASGGNERTTFFMSGGYFQQEGTAIASWLKRYNGAVRVSNKATDKLTLNLNANAGFVRQFTPLAGGAFGNPILSSFFVLPTRSAYKTDGTPNILTSEFPTSSLFNTIALAKMDKRYLKELAIRGSASGEYMIIRNLKFKSAYGVDLLVLEEDQYNNPLYGDGAVLAPGSPTFNPGVTYNAGTSGRAISAYTRYFTWTWTNTLDYHYDILKSGDLFFNVLAGYEAQLSKNYFTTLQARGFSLSPLLYLQYPSSGATPTTTTGAISDYSFASSFGIADIHFRNKYILSGSFRRDGSSRFSEHHKYGNFWSIGASWNVEKESFMQNVKFIEVLKLRASYGVNGNANIGNYDQYPLYGFTATYNSAPGSIPSNVGYPNLTWELNKPLNIGIDIAALKSRVNLIFDWYKRRSEDLLLAVTLPPTTGFNFQTKNIGVMENKGIEITLIGTPIQTKDLTWTVNCNYARNKNKVISLPDHAPIIGTFIIKEGLDVQSFYARVYAGVDAANGDPLWYLDSTRTTKTNAYSTAQRVPYGSASPKYFGAISTTVNYKGIVLDVQFNYSGGNLLQDTWASYYLGAGFNAGFNKVNRVLNRWQKPGDITDIPKYIEGGNKSFHSFSTVYLAKGDFVRLRNLQIGYNLSSKLLSKLKISSLFIYGRGTNLWTHVKDKNLGFDPEEGVSSQTNLDVSIPKTFTFGINIGL